MIGDDCVFKFLRRGVDRKHLTDFVSETSVFKFLNKVGAVRYGATRYTEKRESNVCLLHLSLCRKENIQVKKAVKTVHPAGVSKVLVLQSSSSTRVSI